MNNRLSVAAVLFGLLALIVVGWLYWESRHIPEKVAQVVIATPSKEVKNTPKKTVKPKQVEVYNGGVKLKAKLNLPAALIHDDQQSVIASSKIPAGEHSKTVTTVLNTESGKSETYVRTDPLPLIAYESRGEIGAYYGIKRGEPTIRIQARHDFVQVKALHIGVIGSIDRTVSTGKTDNFIGVGVSYKF